MDEEKVQRRGTGGEAGAKVRHVASVQVKRSRERRDECDKGCVKGFEVSLRFLTVRRCRVRTIYLRGVIFLPFLPSPCSSCTPGRERMDGGGHNGLHMLSHRDDTQRRPLALTWTFKCGERGEKEKKAG